MCTHHRVKCHPYRTAGRAEQRGALREDTAALLTDVTAVGERLTDTTWDRVDAAGTALYEKQLNPKPGSENRKPRKDREQR